MNDDLPIGSEGDAIITAAARCEGMSPRERMELFAELLRQEDAILEKLTPEERRRRLEMADQLDPRPEPWWKNLRPEAIPPDAFNSSDL